MTIYQKRQRLYYVYIMSSKTRVLYIGVTNDLARRVHEHRTGRGGEFTAKYRVRHLVHYEETSDIRSALERERYLKGWTRTRKIELIEAMNLEWKDLSEEWADAPADRLKDPSLRSG